MTDDEIIALVQAHKDGKKIECRYEHEPDNGWREFASKISDWDFVTYEYRIATEPHKPREFWICNGRDKDNERWVLVDKAHPNHVCGGEKIRVREVIE